MIDFPLSGNQPLSNVLISKGIHTFSNACEWVQNLPFQRVGAQKVEELLLFQAGTCSLKHAFMAQLALENEHPEVEMMLGIYRATPIIFPEIQVVLDEKNLKEIPETHAFLRVGNKRYDFSHANFPFGEVQGLFVREQRCDPHQVFDWKPMIHKHYIGGWKTRNGIHLSENELWETREKCFHVILENLDSSKK
jgi:hypothetical protein